jgi:hypothetical protein
MNLCEASEDKSRESGKCIGLLVLEAANVTTPIFFIHSRPLSHTELLL